ncbi:TRM11 [Symbiodinium sp. KB8]|nr:TRM11 [Symbiodinium sp. KB8]
METLRPLFDGDEVVDLRAPDTMMWVLEEHSHRSNEKTHLGKRTRPPRRVFLGRQVAGGRSTDKKRQSGEKCFFHRYDLSQRAVLGPTTLDNELAFIMANCAGVRPQQLGMDPFCGTGGLLIAMAHFGAKLFGGEIDIRVVRGWRIAYTKNKAAVLDAARSRGLSAAGGGAPAAADVPEVSFNMGSESSAGGSGWSLDYLQALGLPLALAPAPGAAKAKQLKQPNNRNAKAEKDPALTSAGGCNIFTNFAQGPSVMGDNAMPPWRAVKPGWLDFIITDPPYGVRACAKKSGRDEAKKKVVIQDVNSYIPSKVSYGEEELSEDLLNFASASLVDGGKLVFLVPVDLADFLGIDRAAVEQDIEGARPNFHDICHPKAGRKKDPRLCVSETTRDPLLLDESRYVDFIPQHVAFRLLGASLQVLSGGLGRLLVTMPPGCKGVASSVCPGSWPAVCSPAVPALLGQSRALQGPAPLGLLSANTARLGDTMLLAFPGPVLLGGLEPGAGGGFEDSPPGQVSDVDAVPVRPGATVRKGECTSDVPALQGRLPSFAPFFASSLNAFRATAIAMAVPGEIEHSLDQCLEVVSQEHQKFQLLNEKHDLKHHFSSLRQEMDALKADNEALKQSSRPPKGKAWREVLNEQINELKAQLYMSSAIGDDEWFKNSATRPSSDLGALVERFRRYGRGRSDHDDTHCGCGLQFVVMLTVLLERTRQQARMFAIIILIIVMSAIEHRIVEEFAAEGMAWLAGADSGSNGISTIFRKESPKKVSFSQVVPKPEDQDERPPSASPFEIEEDAGKPEHAKIQRVTTNDVKRELSFKRRQRQSGPMPTEETLAASKMHMLKKNPFEEQFDAASKKSCVESCADGMKMMFSFSADSNEPIINRIAGGVVFKTLAMVAIVANAVYLGWAADQNVRNSWRRLEGTAKHPTTRDPDVAFFCWFALEIVIRLAAERSCAAICAMSVDLEVGLLSGRSVALKADLEETVETLKRRAQTALAVGKQGRLLDFSGQILDGHKSIKRARLEDGNMLTLQVNRMTVGCNLNAFAAIPADGSVVTWGDAAFGGDSTAVQEKLKSVQQIQAADEAFAAILADGSVVSWGNAESGGDSSAVEGKLKNVKQIQASADAFAAVLADGSVVTWGLSEFGGDSSDVQEQLKNVQQIQATIGAFAAILADGFVVTWGHPEFGGDSTAVQARLQNVQKIQATDNAFAAVLVDGSAVAWGDGRYGGDSKDAQKQLKNVMDIQSSSFGVFAAILEDRSVVTWGNVDAGGDSSAVQGQLKDVQKIQTSSSAWAALLEDGSVVTWGDVTYGGDSSGCQEKLNNVQEIQATCWAFAAILADRSVVTWGHDGFGGDSSGVQHQLQNVKEIAASEVAFAAILADGSVVTWGDAVGGGDSTAVQQQLKNAQHIQTVYQGAFAAVLADGSVVTWGMAVFGGDSSAVRNQLQ